MGEPNPRSHSQRGLIDAVGILFQYVAWVATMKDILKLRNLMGILEGFISNNQEGIRTELGRLLIAKKLHSQCVDSILGDDKKYALAVGDALNPLVQKTEGVIRMVFWVKFYAVKSSRSFQYSTK